MNGIQVKRLGQSIPKMSLGGILTNTASGALSGGMTAGPWGAVAMGGISLISGLLGEANENKMEKERKLAEAKVAQRNRYINDAMRYSNFNKNGNSDNRMYMANGGIVKVKLQKPATKTTNPVESNTPVKQDYVDNGWLDNLGRYVALTPNKINTAADALFSPVTQMGMKSGSHPFQKRYWDNISAAIDDANDITPYEWNNAYSNLGAESAYAAANLIGGKITTGLASATGKAVAPYVSKMIPNIKNPLTKVATKVGNAIKNEAGYIYEGITSKPISKTKVTPKVAPKGMVYDMPERIVPQISQTSSYVPPVKTARVAPSIPTEITGRRIIPNIQTTPYRYPTPTLPPIEDVLNPNKLGIHIKPPVKPGQKLLTGGERVFYQEPVILPNKGLLPQHTGSIGTSANPSLFRTRGITETYAPGYRHKTSNIISNVNPSLSPTISIGVFTSVLILINLFNFFI